MKYFAAKLIKIYKEIKKSYAICQLEIKKLCQFEIKYMHLDTPITNKEVICIQTCQLEIKKLYAFEYAN